MENFIHRVKRGPKAPAVPMPKDKWQGRTFIEADTGDEFDVTSGQMETALWPEGTRRGDNIPARIHIPRGR